MIVVKSQIEAYIQYLLYIYSIFGQMRLIHAENMHQNQNNELKEATKVCKVRWDLGFFIRNNISHFMYLFEPYTMIIVALKGLKLSLKCVVSVVTKQRLHDRHKLGLG